MKNVITLLFALLLVAAMSLNTKAQGIDFNAPVKVFKGKTAVNVVRSGDVTGDGIIDLVAGGYDTLYVLKGNGDGTFVSFWKGKVGVFYDLKIADLTNDGKMDLIFTIDGNYVGFLVNNGSGGFLTLKTYTLGNGANELAVADFDKDGYLDVVAPTSHDLDPHYKYIAVFINNQNSTLKSRVLYSAPPIPYDTQPPVSGYHVNVLDMDDDGYIDIVQPYESKDSMLIYYNNGNGTFNSPARLQIPTRVTRSQVKDLDHDGKEDLIVIGQKDPTVTNPDYLFGFYLQKSGGADQNIIQTYANPNTGQLYGRNVIDDMDQDGDYDLTLTPQCCLDETDYTWTDSLVVYLNQGNLNFNITIPSYTTKISEGIGYFICDDINNDNRPDYIYTSADSRDSSIYVILQKNTITSISSSSDYNKFLLLYPNPSPGILNVVLNSNGYDKKKVLVFDLTGREVFVLNVNNDDKEIKINLNVLRKGMYLLKVEYENGLSNTQHFVLE